MLRRVLILTHRYLGIPLSVVFVLWFVTGIAMIYVGGMPTLSAQARLERLPPLDLGAVRHTAAEAAAVGLLSGVVGLALSYPIVELGMGRWLEENMGAWFPYFRIDPPIYVAGLALAVGLALVASIVPARRASRLLVTDALRRVA